jgi:hypothetical protein
VARWLAEAVAPTGLVVATDLETDFLENEAKDYPCLMVNALRPGGVLLIEEPDFVTMLHAAEPEELRRVTAAAMRHLEQPTPVDVEYGRRALGDLRAVGLTNVCAEGRCPIVTGSDPLSRDFLRLTLEKLREPVLASGDVTEAGYNKAVSVLQDPSVTIVAPMTVAAWGWRADQI